MLRHDTMQREVQLDADGVSLAGTLAIPQDARSIVLFVHGSGSSRHSPRNRFVAQILEAQRIATLLFDLLTSTEEYVDRRTASLRFDIALLTRRLVGATAWTMRNSLTKDLRIGYFGASTGAAAALVAAAQLGDSIGAVVSRGGRPDLAGQALGGVHAPTLLIVGARDETVLELNHLALGQLWCPEKQLVVIPGATHLFEEPGTLEEVAKTAADWFSRHLADETSERQDSHRTMQDQRR
jgi:putative phosphoribosyl transferase